MSTPLRFSPCAVGDVDQLQFDLSLNISDGTSVTGVDFASVPSGMTLMDPAVSGTAATVWFSPTAGNRDYTVSCTFQTSDGKIRTRSAAIFCGLR